MRLLALFIPRAGDTSSLQFFVLVSKPHVEYSSCVLHDSFKPLDPKKCAVSPPISQNARWIIEIRYWRYSKGISESFQASMY